MADKPPNKGGLNREAERMLHGEFGPELLRRLLELLLKLQIINDPSSTQEV